MLVAAFPLAAGGVACLQLQDEGELRRGGVYLAAVDDAAAPAFAPRFEELFAELRAKAAASARLAALLREAEAAAVATRPRLEPAALEGLERVARSAAAADRELGPLPGAMRVEEVVVASMLIFVSEEERYPRPRYKGARATLETLLEVLGA